MTPILCAEHVAKLLQEAFEGYKSTDEKTQNNGITIRSGFLPKTVTAADKQKQNPAIVVRPIEIIDDNEASDIKLQILATAYNEDKDNGHLELYHILEKVRYTLLTNRLVASRNMIELPMKTTIPEEQPFPVWWGYMEVSYNIGQPKPNYFEDDTQNLSFVQ